VTETPAPEPATTTTGWRLQPRHLAALVAVAAAVWLALRSSESLPFHNSGSSAAPGSASEVLRVTLSPDRRDPVAPRSTSPADKTPGPKHGAGDGGHHDQQGGTRESGGGDEAQPTDGDAEPPLIEATIPGVGTVEVGQPELPDTSGLGLPDARPA
jgi:hypothetical protein